MAVAAVAAVSMAACGGPSSSAVAHLRAGAGHRSTPTTVSKGNPTVLLDEWASCMRSHGDPQQADPSIDVHKVIHIPWDPSIPGGYFGTEKGGQGNSGPGQYCRSYLSAAQSALRGGQPPQQPDPVKEDRYAQCMRANGVADFPDPGAGGDLTINIGAGGDLNPSNPTFQRADRACAQKTGFVGFGGGTPPPGTIALDGPGS